MSKLTVARALTTHIAKRMIRLATLIAVSVFALTLLIIGLLAYFLSGWWWIAVIPLALLMSIFLMVRLFVLLIVARIHGDHMNKEQRIVLNEFSEKVEGLLEARATPLPIVVFICIKDLVFHRDITTVKKIISDSTTLKSDYQNLEKLF